MYVSYGMGREFKTRSSEGWGLLRFWVFSCLRGNCDKLLRLCVRIILVNARVSLARWQISFPIVFPCRDLTLNLKFTEIQAAAAEREAAKLQKELDALVEELNDWKEKYQEICVELEQTFNEMAGY